MTVEKQVASVDEAVDGIEDGQTVLIGGFGGSGLPTQLIFALIRRNLRNLTVVSNNAGSGSDALSQLMASGAVRKLVCSFPRANPPGFFQANYPGHGIALELTPQGTLAERIRAGGAGLGGFYTRASAGTELADGKEVRVLDGAEHVLELPIRGHYSLVAGRLADTWGNTVYDKAGRNMGPAMAMAAKTTVVQVPEIVERGSLDPETIVTPGIFVQRLIEVGA